VSIKTGKDSALKSTLYATIETILNGHVNSQTTDMLINGEFAVQRRS